MVSQALQVPKDQPDNTSNLSPIQPSVEHLGTNSKPEVVSSNSMQDNISTVEQQQLGNKEPTAEATSTTPTRKRKEAPTPLLHPMGNEHSQEGQFVTTSSRRPVFIEIFAGTGNLSRWMYNQGFDVICIDYKGNKHTPKFAAIDVDLTADSGQRLLWHLIDTLRPEAIHAGAPCGTSSRAREKELPHSLKVQGAPQPPPLRDYEHPMGKPNLTDFNQQKVSMANRLYRLVFSLIIYCYRNDIIFSVENPWRSWFWAVLTFLARQDSLSSCRIINKLHSVIFDNCCHGASRKKRSRIDATQPTYLQLAADCDDSHTHEPYNITYKDGWKFDTAIEGAYPDLLCQRMASLLAAQVAPGLNRDPNNSLKAKIQAFASRQHKSTPQLIPEFLKVFEWQPGNRELPELCKDLGPSSKGGEQKGIRKMGQFHSPKQFIDKAIALDHPMDTLCPVADVTKRAIFTILTMGGQNIEIFRLNALKHARRLCDELHDKEVELHNAMPEHVRTVVNSKRLLLFQRLLKDTGYDDLQVVEFMQYGVELHGCHDLPPYANSRVVPAVSTVEQLQKEAVWRRKAMQATRDSGDNFDILEKQSLEEASRGYLKGPYDSEEQVSAELRRDDWLLNSRFVLLHGPQQKPRIIDDARRSGLNSTFTITEKLELQDIDVIVAVSKLLRSCVKGRKVVLELASGEKLEGNLHPSWSPLNWQGKALDLAKAYKQVAVADGSRHLGVVGYPGPSGKWRYFISSSLPFGACASVYGFLRICRAIWHLINVFLCIPACHYFDDFPLFDLQALTESAQRSIGALLGMLGWAYATGDKDHPFSSTFTILGARIDLTGLERGILTIENKPGRLDHISQLVWNIQSTQSMADMAVLRGHVVFASGFCLGRFLRPASASLDAALRSSATKRDSGVKRACDVLLGLLANTKPRSIACIHEGPPVLIFTDSAFENGTAHIGALVIDPGVGKPLIFDGKIRDDVVKKWQSRGIEQVISQAELATAVAVRINFKKVLKGRKAIFFIDNEAARYALIKSVSGRSSMQVLTTAFHKCDLDHECYHWIERVPSKSNPADLPTRGKTNDLVAMVQGSYAGQIEFDDTLLQEILSTEEEPPSFSSLHSDDVSFGDGSLLI